MQNTRRSMASKALQICQKLSKMSNGQQKFDKVSQNVFSLGKQSIFPMNRK